MILNHTISMLKVLMERNGLFSIQKEYFEYNKSTVNKVKLNQTAGRFLKENRQLKRQKQNMLRENFDNIEILWLLLTFA